MGKSNNNIFIKIVQKKLLGIILPKPKSNNHHQETWKNDVL